MKSVEVEPDAGCGVNGQGTVSRIKFFKGNVGDLRRVFGG